MQTNPDLPYWLALWRIPKVGTSIFSKICAQFGTIEEAFHAPPQALRALGINADQIALMTGFIQKQNAPVSEGVALDLAWLEQDDCHLITLLDPLYPALLKEISSAPPLLFVRGDPALLNWPQIAIVGSRSSSRQGLQNAYDFAHYFVEQGFAVTSGLALGVDAAAHGGAVAAKGPTIGVTAHGLDKIFPKRNRQLANDMLAQGAWVSEFPIGVVPKPNYFPRRNRIISGLSLGVLVVEAAVKSGSLITARLATEQNRNVFAIPGSIHNPLAKGCHALIRQGAKLVEQAADVTDDLLPLLGYQQQQLNLMLNSGEGGPKPSANEPVIIPSYEQKTSEYQVLKVLDLDPMLVDEIVIRTGLNVADVNAALVMLEIDGAITNYRGGYTLATAS